MTKTAPQEDEDRVSGNIIAWNDDRCIDEIVISNPALVHIEQMDDHAWWIGIEMEDGSYWYGNFIAIKKGLMEFTEQEDNGMEWSRQLHHDRGEGGGVRDIEEIRALRGAVMTHDWVLTADGDHGYPQRLNGHLNGPEHGYVLIAEFYWGDPDTPHPDAEFIVRAPEIVDDLLARVAELEAALAVANAEKDRLRVTAERLIGYFRVCSSKFNWPDGKWCETNTRDYCAGACTAYELAASDLMSNFFEGNTHNLPSYTAALLPTDEEA